MQTTKLEDIMIEDKKIRKAMRKFYTMVGRTPDWNNVYSENKLTSSAIFDLNTICDMPETIEDGTKWIYRLSIPEQLPQPHFPDTPIGDFYRYNLIAPSLVKPRISEADIRFEKKLSPETLLGVIKRLKIANGQQMQINVEYIKNDNVVGAYNLGVVGLINNELKVCLNPEGIVASSVKNGLIPNFDSEAKKLQSPTDAYVYLLKCEKENLNEIEKLKEMEYCTKIKDNMEFFNALCEELIKQNQKKKKSLFEKLMKSKNNNEELSR